MNSRSNRGPLLAALVTAATLSLLLVACGNNGALDARAAETGKETSHSGAADPALDSLEGVTHHG